MSSASFEQVTINTNSNVRMLEVSDGVYLQGHELTIYCQKNGLCHQCGKVKVQRKVKKVFGNNTWEPMTTVKVPMDGKKKKPTRNYMTVKAKIESGHDDTVEYLVYKGYCLNCYTLEQAKRLSGTPFKAVDGSISSVGSHSSNLSGSRTNSMTSGNSNSTTKRRSSLFAKGIFKKKSSKTSTTPHPLVTVGEESTPRVSNAMVRNNSSNNHNTMGDAATSSVLSHDNPHRSMLNTSYESIEESAVVPSPQVRRHYEHEFSHGNRGSPKKRYHSRDLYDTNSTDEEVLPIRDVVRETIHTLQGLNSMIRTLDLSGLRIRMSEPEALARIFRAGKNGTVHLTTLVLNNCGIDDDLMGILGQALYDSLFTTNNRIVGGKNANVGNYVVNDLTKVNKSMRHARMRLESLNLGDNDIGDKGIRNLCLYLESISCELKDLDLSRNSIETCGGVAIFDALKRNPQTKMVSIDLSCNLLRELDDNEKEQPKKPQYSYMSIEAPGRSPGLHGFLSKNKTLKELDLSANRMTDEWVEALCRGLSLNGQSALEKVSLGFNRIGNRGAIAISMCLAVNKSLRLLELNDNHIGNDGAEAILEAMENNTTIKDIAGLWSNKIDKRHIIVSIRQLLVSETREKKQQRMQHLANLRHSQDDSDDSDVDIYITSDSESAAVDGESKETVNHANTEISKATTKSNTETSKATKLLDDENPLETSVENDDDKNISDFLDAADTGALSDLSEQEDEDASESFERLLQEHVDGKEMEGSDGMMETNQEVTHNLFDRMTIMNASPLVGFEHEKCTGIPLWDTRQETAAIKAAIESRHLAQGSRIEVREEIATLERFDAFFSVHDSSVLHLSCHSIDDGIALENGYGAVEALSLKIPNQFSSGNLRDILIFVSSPSALKLGRAFLDAGIKHVVCCQRNDSFRDPIAIKFMESFYEHASQKEALRNAFETALRAVTSSPLAKCSSLVSNRFHLLALTPTRPSRPVFFQHFIPNVKHHDSEKGSDEDNGSQELEHHQLNHILPSLPDYFLGREIEIFKILESLQIADCIEVTGVEGCGKKSVVGASLNYALKRKEMFSMDQVCWIPAPNRAMVDPDSLYGDLLLCSDLIRASFVDLWDRSEELLDCRERLAIELEAARIAVVIDNRSFSSMTSRDALEKFIHFIINSASFAKVVFISNTPEEWSNDTNESVFSSIKRCEIQIDALSFRSTARLFGEISQHVSRNNKFVVSRSATEFTELADTPFVSNRSVASGSSTRRIEILKRIGNGIPSQIIGSAKIMSRKDFDDLMYRILTPEICIESITALESELKRRNIFMDLATQERNYKRSFDLEENIKELDGMRSRFSSLKDLKAQEKVKKAELADAVANRRYDIANELKKDLLILKKKIMKERRSSANRSVENQNGVLSDLKFQLESVADVIEHDSSFVLDDDTKVFDVDCDGRPCTFRIQCGSIFDPKLLLDGNKTKEEVVSTGMGVVYWSNEACSWKESAGGNLLLGLEMEKIQKCVTDLPVVTSTRHGSVRCFMGNSAILDPRSSSVADMVNSNMGKTVAILTVGPYTIPTGQIDALLERDEEFQRFGLRTLRSCYRTCVRQTQRANLQSLVISPLTTRAKHGPLYEETLKIAVREILEEVKFASALNEVRLVGKTAKEASLLAGIMKAMGFSFRVDEPAE